MALNTAISELINEIMQSKEYLMLKNSKLTLSRLPDFNGEVIKLQQIQDQIHQMQKNNENYESLLEEYTKDYERLSKIPEINRYLVSVKTMNQLLYKLFDDINMAIDTSLR